MTLFFGYRPDFAFPIGDNVHSETAAATTFEVYVSYAAKAIYPYFHVAGTIDPYHLPRALAECYAHKYVVTPYASTTGI